MNDMDKLTLELFTNKLQYKKYLSKIEPNNYNEIQEFREKCIEYKNEIMIKVEELLNSDDMFQVQDPFYRFINDIIQEIEKEKEREKYISDEEKEEEDDDDDILFPPDKMNNYKEEEGKEERNVLEKYSFWGKERVIQQNYNSDFISHYPTNTSVRRRFVGRRNSILPKDEI
jgi:hypothetical protein